MQQNLVFQSANFLKTHENKWKTYITEKLYAQGINASELSLGFYEISNPQGQIMCFKHVPPPFDKERQAYIELSLIIKNLSKTLEAKPPELQIVFNKAAAQVKTCLKQLTSFAEFKNKGLFKFYEYAKLVEPIIEAEELVGKVQLGKKEGELEQLTNNLKAELLKYFRDFVLNTNNAVIKEEQKSQTQRFLSLLHHIQTASKNAAVIAKFIGLWVAAVDLQVLMKQMHFWAGQNLRINNLKS